MSKRASGILLHISSLPSSYGIGDFGPEAYRFADFMSRTGQRYWQILPLTKTELKYGNSPYSSPSAFAGNTLFISPELLCREGLVDRHELGRPKFAAGRVNFEKVTRYKSRLLASIFKNRDKRKFLDKDFSKFCSASSDWLDDYALFEVLKTHYKDQNWSRWPKKIRCRDKETLADITKHHTDKIGQIKFEQFLFFRQWRQLKKYCHQKKISIVGDLPIYVNYQSVDVWKDPRFFKLDKTFLQRYSAGVPPDYFSATGQLWGNPVYDWKALKNEGFKWWVNRIRHKMELYDVIRLDHFRGFAAFWQVPAREKTAVNGRWVRVPGSALFKKIKKSLKQVPFIAEDIGYITPDVRALMNEFGFPGMKVLQFAFDGDRNNEYLPHFYHKNCVAYTGTHDNNTIKGWFTAEIGPAQRRMVKAYLNKKIDPKKAHWDLIQLVMASKAGLVIIPMQDILGLGAGAKMNRPGTGDGNWKWRMAKKIPKNIETKLARLNSAVKRI